MVKNLLKNGASLLVLKQTDILSAATVIMLMSLASALLGLLRDRLLVNYFTADLVGIYFAAFRLPDFAFQVLIFGALSVAFIPVFTEYLQKDRNQAWFLASAFLNLATLLFIFIVVILVVFTPALSSLIVPGLSKENPQHLTLLVNLTRIILLTQIFFVFSSFLTGVLQSFQRFLFPALAAVFYNLGIIVGIVFFAPLGMYGVALGIILGALMHFLIQLPLTLSLGFRPHLNFNFSHPGILAVGRLMLPRSLTLAANQINLTVNMSLASLISLSSITFLNFAQHLAMVPVNFFGASIAQAAFPMLSRIKSQGKMEEFKALLISSFHQVLFLMSPVVAILAVLHTPMTRLVFGSRLFDWEATVLTGRTLAFFSIGLAIQGAAYLFMRGFYALHDTKTPLKIGILTLLLNIILSVNFILVFHLPVWSLGLSASVAASVNLFLLGFLLNRRVGEFDRLALFSPVLKIISAASAMALSLWVLIKIFELVFDTNQTLSLLLATLLTSFLGLVPYLFLAWFLNIKEAQVFLTLLKKIGNWRQVLSQTEEIIEQETP